mgnify:CR=1 FL=1
MMATHNAQVVTALRKLVMEDGNADVRSEGMSYGMMIAVQLDHQAEFDRLWQICEQDLHSLAAPQTLEAFLAEVEQVAADVAPDGDLWRVSREAMFEGTASPRPMLAGHLRIGQGAEIGAQAGVISDVAQGAKMLGSPAQPKMDFFRQIATLKKMARGER